MKKIVIPLFVLVLLVAPVAFAQQPNFQYTNDWVTQLIAWSKSAVTFLMVLATLYFIWTVIGYIRVKEAKDAEEKKHAMIRGIIGLFVIVAIWGIIRVLSSTLGVSGTYDQQAPCPPGLTWNPVQHICN
jgi:Na+/proline symporter